MAVVSSAIESDPLFGSVRPIAPMRSCLGSQNWLMYFCFCSSVPMARIAAPQSPVALIDTPMPASPQASCSVRISELIRSRPPPPYCSGKPLAASSPRSWAFCMTAQGVSSFSS